MTAIGAILFERDFTEWQMDGNRMETGNPTKVMDGYLTVIYSGRFRAFFFLLSSLFETIYRLKADL